MPLLRGCAIADLLDPVCNEFAMTQLSSSLSMLLTVTETMAAVSSSLGIVVNLVGETLAFPIIREQCISPL